MAKGTEPHKYLADNGFSSPWAGNCDNLKSSNRTSPGKAQGVHTNSDGKQTKPNIYIYIYP